MGLQLAHLEDKLVKALAGSRVGERAVDRLGVLRHAALQRRFGQGSHNAFMAGLHTSLVVAASAAAVGAVLAMFVRR